MVCPHLGQEPLHITRPHASPVFYSGSPRPRLKDPSDTQPEYQHFLREEPLAVGKTSPDLNTEPWLLEMEPAYG